MALLAKLVKEANQVIPDHQVHLVLRADLVTLVLKDFLEDLEVVEKRVQEVKEVKLVRWDQLEAPDYLDLKATKASKEPTESLFVFCRRSIFENILNVYFFTHRAREVRREKVDLEDLKDLAYVEITILSPLV